MGIFRLRPAADRDLQNIFRYSVKEWGNDRAERYIRDLDSAFQKLADNELKATNADDIQPGLHWCRVVSHIVFFKHTDYGILVIRVLHKGMDYRKHL